MDGIHPTQYYVHTDAGWQAVAGAVTEEQLVCLHVNGHELATLMCTPRDLDELALGFLRAEEIITQRDDVDALTVSAQAACVDVWLKPHVRFTPPRRKVITAGCGGGTTFADLQARREPLSSTLTVEAGQLFARMQDMYQASDLYGATQGIHTAALADSTQILLVAEDIGRHNAVDRLWGKALKQGRSTGGRLLLSTGRISSEMLIKAARMGAPIVASRTSPTSLSVALAEAWNITVVGYVRRGAFRVYSAAQRISSQNDP
jgi:FdhD protein